MAKLPKKYAMLMAQSIAMQKLLETVLDEATGDVSGKKRVWPLKMNTYRQIHKLLNSIYQEFPNKFNGSTT